MTTAVVIDRDPALLGESGPEGEAWAADRVPSAWASGVPFPIIRAIAATVPGRGAQVG